MLGFPVLGFHLRLGMELLPKVKILQAQLFQDEVIFRPERRSILVVAYLIHS